MSRCSPCLQEVFQLGAVVLLDLKCPGGCERQRVGRTWGGGSGGPEWLMFAHMGWKKISLQMHVGSPCTHVYIRAYVHAYVCVCVGFTELLQVNQWLLDCPLFISVLSLYPPFSVKSTPSPPLCILLSLSSLTARIHLFLPLLSPSPASCSFSCRTSLYASLPCSFSRG